MEEIEASVPSSQPISNYTPEIAATILFSSLSFTSSTPSFQKTIDELASISDTAVVSSFFKITMHKLLKVTLASLRPDNSSTEGSLSLARANLLGLAGSLVPRLDSKEIDCLFHAVTPALKDDEGLIQKKAYEVLLIMLQRSPEFMSTKFEKLQNLMINSLPSCHFSAKRYRLECLYFLIVHVLKKVSGQRRHAVIAPFLTEIVLAFKEANKKTRNRAYDILVQIGHACVDEENIGNKDALLEIFNIVAGGLAGETSHMISAAVKGVARMAYEFTDLISATYDLIPFSLLLLRRKNTEIIKANLGLLKVLVAKSQSENLKTHLKTLVDGLLNWQDNAKNHSKFKIKLLIEMLVKKCGLDAVKEVMPVKHLKLLTNIRKVKERRDRKLTASSVDTKLLLSKATTSRSMRTRGASQSLQEDNFELLDDELLDLLDGKRTRSVLRCSLLQKRKRDLDDDLEKDSEGRLVIREDEVPKKKTFSDADSDDRSQAAETSAAPKGSRKGQKRVKQSETGWAYTGNEYASKKARGDVKRKGKLEPYAYWPLDRKMVSKRAEHRAAARKGMSSVVKMSKRLEGKSVSNALSLHALKFKKNKGRKKSK